MKIDLTDVQTVYQGFFRMVRALLRYERFDGDWSKQKPWECLERGEAAAVLMYDPAADVVLMVRQFRVGAWLPTQSGGWTWEFPAGVCDGPDPDATARREVLEETGYQLSELIHVQKLFVSPSYSSERTHFYLGLFDSRQTPNGGGGLAAENEDIGVELLTFDAAWTMMEEGRIDSLSPVLALYWLARYRERLQRDAGVAGAAREID
ncbi:NUDIX domain-containing protein [Magnetofaba australis]|uniref:GDP-mannose pyrophosphatase n=1 Tax=Magnetofaba australis IT-1 TaxID=1434232 RepID=A0A1Y2JZI1_9PROT|nr:NUDIX domain-containing protein [Magnetofaba australis]OSM00308.1 putative NUDIX hydrolase [Magnetofaba australis IT-1]